MKKNLELADIESHWKNWAKTFGTDLRATTKTSTAKQIEIFNLIKNFDSVRSSLPLTAKVLELGCGNGHNLLALYRSFPNYKYEGLDFIEEMISSANANMTAYQVPNESILFKVGNVLEFGQTSDTYDFIFTVRCLINLNSTELQLKTIQSISSKLNTGGYLLMLENSQDSYDKQNILRQSVGLEKRIPADFNHFFNDKIITKEMLSFGLTEIKNENISSLHDLILYVILPMTNGSKIEYENPIVEAAMKLSLAISDFYPEPLGDFGQNRLYLYQKT